MKPRDFLLVLGAWIALAGSLTAAPAPIPREHIYDLAPRGDEAVLNLQIANHRWPDCTTLESASRDMFRLEGARSDPEKALALWKWFRVLVSATGGEYAYEGRQEILCHDPHKIFTVYGHHMCDGQSWAMAGLWRGAGYIAFDECTLGHTTAALRYRDADGQLRFHSFDPQRRYIYWDALHERVSTRSMPIMHGMVYRHLTSPQQIHSLHTSLRLGESRERRWDNSGHVIPSGKNKLAAATNSYYAYTSGKRKGIYAAAGEELQVWSVPVTPGEFKQALLPASRNVASEPAETSGMPQARLHPHQSGEPAEFIYRLPGPYVVADASCEAILKKGHASDTCRLWLSADGQHWDLLFAKESTGTELVRLNLGKSAWKAKRPSAYSLYGFFVKAEFASAKDPQTVGLDSLSFTVHRMLNKRTLPNLRPGENIFRVTADRLAPNTAVEVDVQFRVNGEPRSVRTSIRTLPAYFHVTVPSVPESVHTNYDQVFNDGPLQMTAIQLRAIPASQASQTNAASIDTKTGEAAFSQPSPHPADMTHRHVVEQPERALRETSGFFPQSSARRPADERLSELIQALRTADIERRWVVAESLGNYPEAVDVLLGALEKADADLALFIYKALAQIGDRKAIAPLLARWKNVPRGVPGARYIPDVLAAIGDRSVVPALIEPLNRCRFDFRFHIVHALSILGGPEAEKALADIAAHDPYPALRDEAAALLRAKSNSNGAAARPLEIIPPATQLQPDHPRLLLRPSAGPHAIGVPELSRLERDRDFDLLLGPLRQRNSAAAQAMVWLLSTNEAAAQRSLEILRGYRMPREVDTFHVFFNLTQLALAYDWLHEHPQFTPALKAEVREQVRPLAEQALRFADDHMFHNYIWMSAGGVALWAMATAGDDAEADRLLERVRARFNRGLFPAWKYLDGLPSEPMGYWTLYVFTPGALTLLATRSAYATNVFASIREQDGNWFERHFLNVIHSTLPNQRFVPWGDLQEGPNGGVTREVAGIMDALTWATGLAEGAWFSQWLARERGPSRFYGDSAIFYFLYSRRLPGTAAQPVLSFFAGTNHSGHFIARSSWETNATIVTLRATDHFGDHHHYDQGSFTIYRQGLLAVDPPVYPTIRGPQQPTAVHNTLLVAGQPQRPVRGQWFKTVEDFQQNLAAGRQLETGNILFWREGGDWAGVRAELGQAYPAAVLSDWVRQLVFLRPDRVLVLDQLAGPGGGPVPELEWLLQLPVKPTMAGDGFHASQGRSWIRCRPLQPLAKTAGITPTQVRTVRLGLTYTNCTELIHLLEVGDGVLPPDTIEVDVNRTADALLVAFPDLSCRFSRKSPYSIEVRPREHAR